MNETTPELVVTESATMLSVPHVAFIAVAALIIGMLIHKMLFGGNKQAKADLNISNDALSKANAETQKANNSLASMQALSDGKDKEIAALKESNKQLDAARKSVDPTVAKSLDDKNKQIANLETELDTQIDAAHKANKEAGEQQARADQLAKELEKASKKLGSVEVQDAAKLAKYKDWFMALSPYHQRLGKSNLKKKQEG